MAQGIARIGDICNGVCGGAPVPCLTSNSPNVLVNGIPAVTIGCYWNTHQYTDDDWHDIFTIIGNSKVLINGKPVVRISDVLSNGEIVITGSPNVLA